MTIATHGNKSGQDATVECAVALVLSLAQFL